MPLFFYCSPQRLTYLPIPIYYILVYTHYIIGRTHRHIYFLRPLRSYLSYNFIGCVCVCVFFLNIYIYEYVENQKVKFNRQAVSIPFAQAAVIWPVNIANHLMLADRPISFKLLKGIPPPAKKRAKTFWTRYSPLSHFSPLAIPFYTTLLFAKYRSRFFYWKP